MRCMHVTDTQAFLHALLGISTTTVGAPSVLASQHLYTAPAAGIFCSREINLPRPKI